MIDVSHLTFEYPGNRALDDVSFSIAANTVTALVGPNGAGKTTLMRCLCGLERPLAGAIAIDGIDVIEQPRLSHERIGFLSDFFGLYDALAVRQVLEYAAGANGMRSGVADAVARTATALGLDDRLSQHVGELSRGLRQRVAIAQALIHAPGVLILDEPASGLDPEARHDLAALFKSLHAAGMTLLVSSHILAELEAYATDMLVIRDGRIVEQRALKAPAAAARRIAIDVTGDPGTLAGTLAARPEIEAVETEGTRVLCVLRGGDDAQRRLLEDLVRADVPVIGFAVVERDLQQSYLDSIRSLERATP